jgi:REP element-mobilizing transposase RayT
LEFQESVLCELNQCIQDRERFLCHAFEPLLKLVSSSESRESSGVDGHSNSNREESYKELFNSDKVKYERALALQRLKRDPDAVYIELKYNFVWNVLHREAVFYPANDFIDVVNDSFRNCGERIGGLVYLRHLASDHVHVYVESDGDLSVEDMVQRIKKFTNKVIGERFPALCNNPDGDIKFWDEAYFVETVG